MGGIHLHEKLGLHRKEKQLLQREVAAQMGVSRALVALWETGKRKPDAESTARLARLLGVSTDYLIGLSDEPVDVSFAQADELHEGAFATSPEGGGRFTSGVQAAREAMHSTTSVTSKAGARPRRHNLPNILIKPPGSQLPTAMTDASKASHARWSRRRRGREVGCLAAGAAGDVVDVPVDGVGAAL